MMDNNDILTNPDYRLDITDDENDTLTLTLNLPDDERAETIAITINGRPSVYLDRSTVKMLRAGLKDVLNLV